MTFLFFINILDELAIVLGAQEFGFIFHDRSPKSVTITTLDAEERYEILNVIEFTNFRKKMSVIIRTPDSRIKLYCKVEYHNNNKNNILLK